MPPKRTKRDVEASTEWSYDLDDKKRVTVRLFNGVSLVDIREFYVDKETNEKKPGKKGISLTEDAWRKLVGAQSSIDDALASLGGKKRKISEETSESKRTEDASESKGNKDASKDEE